MKIIPDFVADWQIRNAARRIGRLGDPAAAVVAEAFAAACEDRLAPEERAWVERIEGLRSKYEACEREISKTDYGAGKKELRRSEEEAYRGTVTTTTVARACRASKPPMWALFLFHLVRRLRPGRGLELGTCLGISAAYQAAAQLLNGAGSLITLEGDPALAALAEDGLRELGLTGVRLVPGRFQDTLAGVLDEHGPFDYAFIDGHHDGPATLRYFGQIVSHLAPRALLVFDDITWPGMRPAWREIAGSGPVGFAAALGDIGVCSVHRVKGGQAGEAR